MELGPAGANNVRSVRRDEGAADKTTQRPLQASDQRGNAPEKLFEVFWLSVTNPQQPGRLLGQKYDRIYNHSFFFPHRSCFLEIALKIGKIT